jgi:hypothetical protein
MFRGPCKKSCQRLGHRGSGGHPTPPDQTTQAFISMSRPRRNGAPVAVGGILRVADVPASTIFSVGRIPFSANNLFLWSSSHAQVGPARAVPRKSACIRSPVSSSNRAPQRPHPCALIMGAGQHGVHPFWPIKSSPYSGVAVNGRRSRRASGSKHNGEALIAT